MGKFRYIAKNRMGQSVTGVQEGPDDKTVLNGLRSQGLFVLSVTPAEITKSSFFQRYLPSGKKKIKLGELVLFSRQLATMIDSGIPLVQGLDILSEQIENKGFQEIIRDVKKDVTAGLSFFEALAKHPGAFSPLFVNMVKAGEASGALDDIMERLATYLEKTDSLARKVRSAMIYPAVVSIMAFLITLLLMVKVVPVFKNMFADFGGKLPLPTLVLIGISDFLIHTIVYWIVGLVIAAVFLKRFFSTEKGSVVLDRFKLQMPIFGIILRKVAVSKFSRTLSTLVKSGVPILNALEIVGKTAGNKIIEDAVSKVRTSIREGESITAPLIKTKVFPPMVVRMIAVGEQTGQLEKMLNKIADFYDDQVDATVSGLTSLIEPLVIAFLGVVIGGIVICMFMPIFKIAALVQGPG